MYHEYWHVHQFHHTSTNINLTNIYCTYCHIRRIYHVVRHSSHHHVSCFRLYTSRTHQTSYILTSKHMLYILYIISWFTTCHISWYHVSENSVQPIMFSVGYQTIHITSHISRSMHKISTYSSKIMLNAYNQICVHSPTRPALICLDIQKTLAPAERF